MPDSRYTLNPVPSSFYIPYNSLVANHSSIQRCIIWVVLSICKQTKNKKKFLY
jgi:hypothetical protein